MKIAFALTLIVLLARGALAQQAPHLAYVYPAGGQAGTTFQIVVGGQFLMPVTNVFITEQGIEASLLECIRPMNQKDFNDLRDRLRVLAAKLQASRRGNPGTNVWTPEDARESEEISAKIAKNPPNRAANPALVETAVIKVSIPTNAALGECELRLATRNALSNPLRFRVANLPEVTKLAAKPANLEVDRLLERFGRKPAPPGTPKYESRVSPVVTVNGQIMPGGVDRYRLSAARGQRLVIAASARALIPYLADAVPGWFEATLTIFDGKGRELAKAQRHQFRPDPVLCFEPPDDGEYTVEIHDAIFRGREDFVYRLTIGEVPFVTSIFPLGGRAGEKTAVTLTGWNLPVESLVRDNSGFRPGITTLDGDWFNTVPFAVDDLPECFAGEANHAIENAQTVTLPVVVNGRISRPGDCSVFKFEGRAAQRVVAEVVARRLDSPLDSYLRLTDATGKTIAFNDDFEDKSEGLETHHADSRLAATLPADATYFVQLGDTQGRGGPEFAYRLRLSEPRPDFALRVVPSSLVVRAGMNAPVKVIALRKDGFTNAIDLRLKNAPPGGSLSGARIAENQDQAQFTLKAPRPSAGEPISLAIEGTAVIAGQTVVHPAVPAEDMMQAFAYRHLVPAHELQFLVAENPRPLANERIRVLSQTPVPIPAGGNARIQVATPTPMFVERFKLELNGAPEGISLLSVAPVTNGIELVIGAEQGKIRSGTRGNLIIDLLPRNPAAGPPRRVVAGTLPAIPFTVVPETPR